MASLKEIKGRINSINGTLKITSAMKLVASSKLRKAQTAIGNLLPYERQLRGILADLLSAGGSPSACGLYMSERPVKKVALVAVSSNTSLCGAFNSSVSRHFMETVSEYREIGLADSDIKVFPVGRKIADTARKAGFPVSDDYSSLSDKPVYSAAKSLAACLTDMFASGDVDKVELIYTHFHSSSTQIPVRETYLPVSLSPELSIDEEEDSVPSGVSSASRDYIVEPSADDTVSMLLPKVLSLKIYAMLLDANAAEHAARTMAMQIASDNGTRLLQEITLQYNKRRQQAITDELQDIIGGTLA